MSNTKKPTKLYGILDDFNDVIKWQQDMPSSNYKYVIKRVKVELAVDWGNFEESPF